MDITFIGYRKGDDNDATYYELCVASYGFLAAEYLCVHI